MNACANKIKTNTRYLVRNNLIISTPHVPCIFHMSFSTPLSVSMTSTMLSKSSMEPRL